MTSSLSPDSTAAQVLRALGDFRYKLKDEGNGEWRLNSPFRSDSDSHSFKLHIDDDEHGGFIDHSSQGGTPRIGSLYDLADFLGIERKEKAEETKRSYKDLNEYAEAHGVRGDVFREAKWTEGTHPKSGRRALIYQAGDYRRYRLIDGEKPYFLWEEGGHPVWYGMARAINIARKITHIKPCPIIFTNGAPSVVVAQHFGMPAFTVEGGEGQLSPELIGQLLNMGWRGEVLIALDCDETGQAATIQAAKLFHAAGFTVKMADLGLTDKGDLADFCRLHMDQAFTDLIMRATAYEAPIENLIETLKRTMRGIEASAGEQEKEQAQLDGVKVIRDAADRLLNRLTPVSTMSFTEAFDPESPVLNPIKWRLRTGISQWDVAVGALPNDFISILAATNMGKSWLAASLADGLNLIGPGVVISSEMTPEDWLRRMLAHRSRVPIGAILNGMSAEEHTRFHNARKELQDTHSFVIRESAPTIAQISKIVEERVKRGLCEWLIVDSAQNIRSSKNSIYDRMTEIAGGLQKMALDYSMPVLATSQVGRDVAERPEGRKAPMLHDGYGSGALEQNAGVVVGLYRHEYYVNLGLENDDFQQFPPNTARLYVLKHRHADIPHPNWRTIAYLTGCGYYSAKEWAQPNTKREEYPVIPIEG